MTDTQIIHYRKLIDQGYDHKDILHIMLIEHTEDEVKFFIDNYFKRKKIKENDPYRIMKDYEKKYSKEFIYNEIYKMSGEEYGEYMEGAYVDNEGVLRNMNYYKSWDRDQKLNELLK